MDHRIILKCRICLDEFDEDEMFDLFVKTKRKNRRKKCVARLFEKVEFCCGVQIRESPEMPTKICAKCFDMTRIWFNFRQMCLNSQVYLESLCQDREKPIELEGKDSEYLEFLMQELQMHAGFSSTEFNYDELEGKSMQSDVVQEIDEEFIEPIALGEFESEMEFDEFRAIPKVEIIKADTEDEDVEVVNAADEDEDEMVSNFVEDVRCEPTKRGKHKPKKNPRRSGGAAKRAVGARDPVSTDPPTTYMCSICGNVYTKKAAFTYHMGQHSSTKPHECELCGKTFRQVCELKNHMRRHTGEKPFKCSFCDRHFIDRGEKHRHERVHTNTRPYKCQVCHKSFTYSAILKNHSKLHSGEKDYNCVVCRKAFTLPHQLKAHLQTMTHKQRETQFVADGSASPYGE